MASFSIYDKEDQHLVLSVGIVTRPSVFCSELVIGLCEGWMHRDITGATDLFHKNLKYLDDLSNDFQLHISKRIRSHVNAVGVFLHQPTVYQNQSLHFQELSVDNNFFKRGIVTELLARMTDSLQ